MLVAHVRKVQYGKEELILQNWDYYNSLRLGTPNYLFPMKLIVNSFHTFTFIHLSHSVYFFYVLEKH